MFGSGFRAEIRLFGFSPEGDISLPVFVILMNMGVDQPKGGLLRYEFTPYFRPHTQQPSGLGKGPRRWLRVKRIFALSEQEVQGFLKNSGTVPKFSNGQC
jgi:hypothetical protein